jgi:hypothetical protein
MQLLLNMEEAEEKLHRELHECLRMVQDLAAGDPSSLDDGIARLRHLRRSVFEFINQIQHEGLIVKAARLLEREHGFGADAKWKMNPRQTGTLDEADLRISVNGEIKISAEATASEAPIGILDNRMIHTLTKLNQMSGKKYYFVRTDEMVWRAKTKIQKAKFDIQVILPHDRVVPTVRLKEDLENKVKKPALEDQARPRRFIRSLGDDEMEPLPLYKRLNNVGENWYNMPGLAPEYDGRPVWNNLHVVEPNWSRYGCLPHWFPSKDARGRTLTPTAQVDRFLCYLGDLVEIPDDHRKMDPVRLVEGLFELYDSYESGSFHDWDEDHEWDLAEGAAQSESGTIEE